MGKLALFIVTGLALVGCSSLFTTTSTSDRARNPSSNSERIQLQEADVDILASFLNKKVEPLSKSVYLWHWFLSDKWGSQWQKAMPSENPLVRNFIKTESALFFRGFCADDPNLNPEDCADGPPQFGRGEMMGAGLYFAVDPVASASYASTSPNWVLVQIQLPKGSHIINLQAHLQDPVEGEVAAVLRNNGCTWPEPVALWRVLKSSRPNDANAALPNITAQCRLFVREALKNRLHIDGIFFDWLAVGYSECQPPGQVATENQNAIINPAHTVAFVMANDLPASASVKVFNRKTTDAKADRTRIESFYYKADHDRPNISAFDYFNKNFDSLGFPDYKYEGMTGLVCSGGKCQATMKICSNTDSKDCKVVSLPYSPPPYPALISKASPPDATRPAPHPLWGDLTGRTPDISAWIMENLFSCPE